MRIVFVTPYFYPAWQYGGTPKAAYELARALLKRGHELTVLTTDSLGDSRLKHEKTAARAVRNVDGLAVHYYPNISNWLACRHRIFIPIGLVAGLKDSLKDADVVHIHEFRSLLTVAASPAARRAGVPYIVSPHGGLKYLGKELPKRLFDLLWGQRILKNAAVVTVLSDVEKKDAAAFGVTARQIEFLPNPIDLEEFEQPVTPGGFRSEWGITGPMILFLGRLHWIKGADLLLRAFTGLKGFPGARLVFAGPDDGQKAELTRHIGRGDLGSRVIFTGHLDGPKRLAALKDADVVVIPSRSEAFSITAIESLLCGTPVVVSSCCGLPPALDEQSCVIRFTNEDVADLQQVLSEALENKDQATNCFKAQKIIAEELSTARIAERAESVYSRVIMGASGHQ